MQAELGSFDAYVWSFVDGTPIIGDWQHLGDLPTSTDEATALSKDLKRRGFRFVGPTTMYAFMQAAGPRRRPRRRLLPPPARDYSPGRNSAVSGAGARSPASIASSSISARSWTLTSSSRPFSFTPSSIIT